MAVDGALTWGGRCGQIRVVHGMIGLLRGALLCMLANDEAGGEEHLSPRFVEQVPGRLRCLLDTGTDAISVRLQLVVDHHGAALLFLFSLVLLRLGLATGDFDV